MKFRPAVVRVGGGEWGGGWFVVVIRCGCSCFSPHEICGLWNQEPIISNKSRDGNQVVWQLSSARVARAKVVEAQRYFQNTRLRQVRLLSPAVFQFHTHSTVQKDAALRGTSFLHLSNFLSLSIIWHRRDETSPSLNLLYTSQLFFSSCFLLLLLLLLLTLVLHTTSHLFAFSFSFPGLS